MTSPAVVDEKIVLEQMIDAPVEQVWSYWTNRDDVCDWLAHDAHVRVEEGGFSLLISRRGPWHGYCTYTAVEENKQLAFSFLYLDKSRYQVELVLNDSNGFVDLTLSLHGIEDAEFAAQQQAFWKENLRILKSILETGANPILTERPMIGIIVNLEAANLPDGVQGVLVNRAVEGYSASAAGIQQGDVITAVKGERLDEVTNIGDVLRDNKVGDVVPVTYWRDGEETTVDMELKGFPVPPVPESFEAMAQDYEAEYEMVNKAMAEALDGVTSEIAEYTPDEEDPMSIRGILAQMILQQRHTLEWLSTYANGPRRINPYVRERERMAAIIAAMPAAEDLFAELKRKQRETVAMIHQLPKELEARKNYLWWMTIETSFSDEQALMQIRDIGNLKYMATNA